MQNDDKLYSSCVYFLTLFQGTTFYYSYVVCGEFKRLDKCLLENLNYNDANGL